MKKETHRDIRSQEERNQSKQVENQIRITQSERDIISRYLSASTKSESFARTQGQKVEIFYHSRWSHSYGTSEQKGMQEQKEQILITMNLLTFGGRRSLLLLLT